MQITTPIAQTLIEELARIFPNRCPDPTDSDRDIWMKVGAQQVISYLKYAAEQQEKQRRNQVCV